MHLQPDAQSPYPKNTSKLSIRAACRFVKFWEESVAQKQGSETEEYSRKGYRRAGHARWVTCIPCRAMECRFETCNYCPAACRGRLKSCNKTGETWQNFGGRASTWPRLSHPQRKRSHTDPRSKPHLTLSSFRCSALLSAVT